jgi:HEAT repeat protein
MTVKGGPRVARSAGDSAADAIRSLISQLASEDGITRVKARRQIVGYKRRAVGALVEALSDKRHWVRWEAAKSLTQIGNADSIQALLEALSDPESDVRWLAAEGLIRIGRKSIVPLLTALVERPDSRWLLEGIHHVLHDLKRKGLGEALLPVLAALEGTEPSLEAPLAARKALLVLNASG